MTSQEVSPFPAGDHKAINRRARKQNKNKTEINNIDDPRKKFHLANSADPDEMLRNVAFLGLHCLPKHLFAGTQNDMG